MAENKGKGNDWFPNLNHILLILLAGTIFIPQSPFHESRPKKSETSTHVYTAHARLWEDPFEAVEKYIEKHKKLSDASGHSDMPPSGQQEKSSDQNPKTEELPNMGGIQKDIEDILSANDQKNINIVAVMLPDGDYYEDSEDRRKLRYAVLSGFNATLKYMPEEPNRIKFFSLNQKGTTDDPGYAAYEWLVYKPTKHYASPHNDTRPYERPSILLLWLNEEDFRIKPHQKLKDLINKRLDSSKIGSASVPGSLSSETLQDDLINNELDSSKIGSVSVLGPLGSENLQDLVNEMTHPDCDSDSCKQENNKYHYYSPSATMDEWNLLKDICRLPTNKASDKDSHTINHCSDEEAQQIPPTSLHVYFEKQGLSFLRVTATDKDLAGAVKNELSLRGIQASKQNRILLIGEWDSLYDFHLAATFAAELLKGRDSECSKGTTFDGLPLPIQDYNEQYDDEIQCIFRSSYLRGLDGEKLKASDGHGNLLNENKDIGNGDNKITGDLENANGDSQFDYVRRLATQIGELDKKIRDNKNPDTHAIKAIGILGSDVYDKLLISEALHSKFPDAVFFTNGIDARLLEPKNNKWARNLIMASSFGLSLNRHLQRDIPPFRDNIQTAYFLATEMALTKQFGQQLPSTKTDQTDKTEYLTVGKDFYFLSSILKPEIQDQFYAQDELNKLMEPVQLFEIGHTSIFNLNSSNNSCPPEEPHLHPCSGKKYTAADISGLLALIVSAVCLYLILDKSLKLYIGLLSALPILLVFSYPYIKDIKPYIISSLIIITFIIITKFINKKYKNTEQINSDETYTKKMHARNVLIISFIAIGILSIWYIFSILYDSEEPFAFFEGVSMWPSQAVRLIALLLTGYFIYEAFMFPPEFTKWLTKHLYLTNKKPEIINKWAEININTIFIVLTLLYIIETALFFLLGIPNTPYRGEYIFSLNIILMQGLLAPAFLILLVLVSYAAIKAVKSVEYFHEEIQTPQTNWPIETLDERATPFNIKSSDAHEWASMFFVIELTKRIYKFIGYPLIIALLIVLARSNYFDNLQMPLALKLIIGFSLVWLGYCDYRLKRATEKARENALKSLRTKVIAYKGNNTKINRGEQLERLIAMIENADEVVYKPFSQRPIFIYSLLIIVAWKADSIDYNALLDKFF